MRLDQYLISLTFIYMTFFTKCNSYSNLLQYSSKNIHGSQVILKSHVKKGSGLGIEQLGNSLID